MILVEQTVVKLVKIMLLSDDFWFSNLFCFMQHHASTFLNNNMPLLFSIYYIKDSFGVNIVYCFNFHIIKTRHLKLFWICTVLSKVKRWLRGLCSVNESLSFLFDN